jgi:hypothetical protein
MLHFNDLAQQYADRVLNLMMPMSAQASHVSQRGGGVAVMSPSAVAAQARQMLPMSAQLIQAGAEKLSDSHPQERIEVQLQLLAKALTDLAISQQLLDCADDEKLGIMPQVAGTSRSASMFDVNTYLRVLVNGMPSRPRAKAMGIDRNAEFVNELASTAQAARFALGESIGAALDNVLLQTAAQGQAAFRGLLSIGVFQLGKATAIVGNDIAKVLGLGAEVSELYKLVNEYVGKAYETIVTLLGRELSGLAVERAMDFFGALKDGALLGDLLERLFETQRTRADLRKLIEESDSEPQSYNRMTAELETLLEHFKSIMDFVEKVLTGLKFVGMIPAAAMPQAQLVMSATHAVMFAFIVLTGADFADSPRVKMLNRVPGVRDLVATSLMSNG